MRACAKAQSRQSLCCSQTCSRCLLEAQANKHVSIAQTGRRIRIWRTTNQKTFLFRVPAQLFTLVCFYHLSESRRGWSGGAKVLCILHHWGVQLILAYSWARPAILVVGKGRGGMFLFLLFLHFHSCSSFFPVPLFHLLYSLLSLFSLSLGDDTKWPSRVDVSLNPNTINSESRFSCFFFFVFLLLFFFVFFFFFFFYSEVNCQSFVALDDSMQNL